MTQALGAAVAGVKLCKRQLRQTSLGVPCRDLVGLPDKAKKVASTGRPTDHGLGGGGAQPL
eukprot:2665647-Alexandrium_andersonii.AAC.1